MRIIFTRHSLRRMCREGVDLEDVRQVLNQGERIESIQRTIPSRVPFSWAGRVADRCMLWRPTSRPKRSGS